MDEEKILTGNQSVELEVGLCSTEYAFKCIICHFALSAIKNLINLDYYSDAKDKIIQQVARCERNQIILHQTVVDDLEGEYIDSKWYTKAENVKKVSVKSRRCIYLILLSIVTKMGH